MTIKQSYYKKDKDEVKTQIIKDRLAHLFKENGKAMAKILMFLIKRNKKNV